MERFVAEKENSICRQQFDNCHPIYVCVMHVDCEIVSDWADNC